MGAMGLSLQSSAIIAPLRNIRLVLVTLGLNFAVAPAFAWLLTLVIPLAPGHAIGLLLLSGAAGAPFLPKLVINARGDLSVAGAILVLLTAGTIVFLPFALPHMVPGFQASAWSVARPLLLFIVLPLVTGILVRSRAASFAARAGPVLAVVGNACLLLLVVLLVAMNFRAIAGVVGSGAILAALLYIAGLFAAGWLAGSLHIESRGIVALATAARNFGAALVPASESFTDPNVMTMLVVSAIVCIVVTFLAAAWVRKRQAAQSVC
jgi:BASS family bile acid:Na+ symporter